MGHAEGTTGLYRRGSLRSPDGQQDEGPRLTEREGGQIPGGRRKFSGAQLLTGEGDSGALCRPPHSRSGLLVRAGAPTGAAEEAAD